MKRTFGKTFIGTEACPPTFARHFVEQSSMTVMKSGNPQRANGST